MLTIGVTAGPLNHALDVARHLVLPAITLSLFYWRPTRLMRASMLEVSRVD
jgi:peptide/nickel transport system permease protein